MKFFIFTIFLLCIAVDSQSILCPDNQNNHFVLWTVNSISQSVKKTDFICLSLNDKSCITTICNLYVTGIKKFYFILSQNSNYILKYNQSLQYSTCLGLNENTISVYKISSASETQLQNVFETASNRYSILFEIFNYFFSQYSGNLIEVLLLNDNVQSPTNSTFSLSGTGTDWGFAISIILS